MSRTWLNVQTEEDDEPEEEDPFCQHGIDRTEERCSECDKWDRADWLFDFYGDR